MKTSARQWWVLAGVAVALVVAVRLAELAPRRSVTESSTATHGGDGGVGAVPAPQAPQSEILVLDALVQRAVTAASGAVIVERGTGAEMGKTVVRWELGFSRGVWSLRFVVGSPHVTLRFLDLSRSVSEGCHALSAHTERGPAPFPEASFDATARTVTLADMPLEVVEALTRARELTLGACDVRFVLDDTQQRVLIDFYVQAMGAILDAVSVDAGTGVAAETR